MQFLADIKLECDVCKGRRFQEAVLEIEYNKKNYWFYRKIYENRKGKDEAIEKALELLN